jgi:hypothetical protein
MANKHVTNPCSTGGTPALSQDEIAYWVDPSTNTHRVVCPECLAFISVNRKSKLYRKHNVGENRWLSANVVTVKTGTELIIQ